MFDELFQFPQKPMRPILGTRVMWAAPEEGFTFPGLHVWLFGRYWRIWRVAKPSAPESGRRF